MAKSTIVASLALAAIGFVAVPAGSAVAATLNQANRPVLSLTQNTMNANYAYDVASNTSGITEQSLSTSGDLPSYSNPDQLRSHPNQVHRDGDRN
ncbi:MAG TPA: hypothetical protein VL418_13850 [Devosiaceae bacterium]|nr:hypothetical protein [Devosiaceae bacterium]